MFFVPSRRARLALATLLLACFTATRSPGADAPSDPVIQAAGVPWFNDYYTAYRAAEKHGHMLLVYLAPADGGAAAQSIDAAIAARPDIQKKLLQVVRCRVPHDATIDVEGESKRLTSSGAFSELHGGPGFVLIDLVNKDAEFYGHTVTALPLSSGKYYHWSIDGLATALNLPPGTITQRSMIWAVRMHPERPQSTGGGFHPTLADGATFQASYQANVQQQGHQNFNSRFQTLSSAAGSSVTEVCAESWPNQTMLDSCIDCVDSWRHSSGHWNGVSRPHRVFGYDIRRGRNGIWYGTGLFAD